MLPNIMNEDNRALDIEREQAEEYFKEHGKYPEYPKGNDEPVVYPEDKEDPLAVEPLEDNNDRLNNFFEDDSRYTGHPSFQSW